MDRCCSTYPQLLGFPLQSLRFRSIYHYYYYYLTTYHPAATSGSYVLSSGLVLQLSLHWVFTSP